MNAHRILCYTLIAAVVSLSNQMMLACSIKLPEAPPNYAWGQTTPDIQKTFKIFAKDETAYFIADYTLIKVIKNPNAKHTTDSPVAYHVKFDRFIKRPHDIDKYTHILPLPVSGKKITEEAIIVPSFTHAGGRGMSCPYSVIADLNTKKTKGRLFFEHNQLWQVLYPEEITDPKDKALLKEMEQQYSK